MDYKIDDEVVKLITLFRKRKALSLIISTIILTAVAITISFSVSYWMGGVSSVYTSFEKIECLSATPTYDVGLKLWSFSFVIRNGGTSKAIITNIYVNERAVASSTIIPTPGNCGTDIPETGVSINTGATTNINVYLRSGGVGQSFSGLTAHSVIIVKFVTASGFEYEKVCEISPP